MTSTIGNPEENNIYLSESARISNNIRTILLSLFALIGFVILVFAIFTARVSVELVQIATSVFLVAFIAAIVGAFTLFGVVVYQIRGETREK
jgi:ABC-type antimicrobial peptide transport system permease subunit